MQEGQPHVTAWSRVPKLPVALALCPCPGSSKVGAGVAWDLQPRTCSCLWGKVSSLWGSWSGQLLETIQTHPPALILVLLPGFG